MKAIVYTEYGPADVLHLQDVDKPTPKDDEVLIKVHATSVTAGDCNARGFVFVPPGFGFLARLMFGLRKPRQPILGMELSGEIIEVGKEVKLFKKGDQVFGTSVKYGANRWANIIAGIFHTALVAWSLTGATQPLFYLFFASTEIVCTLFITWYAWKWRNPEGQPVYQSARAN